MSYLSFFWSESTVKFFLLVLTSFGSPLELTPPHVRLFKFICVVSQSNVQSFYFLSEKHKFILIFVQLSLEIRFAFIGCQSPGEVLSLSHQVVNFRVFNFVDIFYSFKFEVVLPNFPLVLQLQRDDTALILIPWTLTVINFDILNFLVFSLLQSLIASDWVHQL